MRKSKEQRDTETARYFVALEHEVLRRLRREAASDEGREALLRTTGIHDPALITELGRLGITADALIALRLFPLVLVAWAENGVDQNERQAVMAEAANLGMTVGSTAWIVLEQWLIKQPPGLCVDAWRRYTHDMFEDMTPQMQERLIELTESQMTAVAKSSGGHLGIGKVSKREAATIHQVVTAMRQQA
ncbi:MAG: hypothetical protein WBD20_27630 [Pirellulaceae bacterium]